MRRVEALTGWGGAPSWIEVEGDVGAIGPEDGSADVAEIPIVILRVHAATSPDEEGEMEAPPSRIGLRVLWLEPTCAFTIAQATALRDALDAAIEGTD